MKLKETVSMDNGDFTTAFISSPGRMLGAFPN
jgi:hypothetical protein